MGLTLTTAFPPYSDWAANTYNASGCNQKFPACSYQVGYNGSSYSEAYWQVSSLRAYTSGGGDTNAANSPNTNVANGNPPSSGGSSSSSSSTGSGRNSAGSLHSYLNKHTGGGFTGPIRKIMPIRPVLGGFGVARGRATPRQLRRLGGRRDRAPGARLRRRDGVHQGARADAARGGAGGLPGLTTGDPGPINTGRSGSVRVGRGRSGVGPGRSGSVPSRTLSRCPDGGRAPCRGEAPRQGAAGAAGSRDEAPRMSRAPDETSPVGRPRRPDR